MNQVYTFVEFFILLQDIDTGMNNDSPDPSFESAPVFKCVNLCKDLDKTLLQHIFCIFPVVGKTITYCQHLGAVPVVQFPLGGSIIF